MADNMLAGHADVSKKIDVQEKDERNYTVKDREAKGVYTTDEACNGIISERDESEAKQEKSEDSPKQDLSWLRRYCIKHPIITICSVIALTAVFLIIFLATFFTQRDHKAPPPGPSKAGNITVNAAPTTASAFLPLQEAYLSYAIEFSFFPDFAGNLSSPNTFSLIMLENIGNLTGTKPYVRIGGNTQDYALYNDSLEVATVFGWNRTASNNYPSKLQIGKSFFESYQTWPDVKFTHGFNMALSDTAEGWASLMATVPLACKALSNDNLLWWEYGNEADGYGSVRPKWNTSLYLEQWHNGTAGIQRALNESCPDLNTDDKYGYVGPSLSGRTNLPPARVFGGTKEQPGINDNGDIKIITMHHYMGSTENKGVSLQRTLMNHTNIVSKLNEQLSAELALLSNSTLVNAQSPSTPLPLTLNEANSLVHNDAGPHGLLTTFGSALWSLDYLLHAFAMGLSRVHLQLGTDFRYSSWQPVTTSNVSLGVLPTYYGNVAAAAVIGADHYARTRVVPLEITAPNAAVAVPAAPAAPGDAAAASAAAGPGGELRDRQSAYATFVDGALAKLVLINMVAWNSTVWRADAGGGGGARRRAAAELQRRPRRLVGVQLGAGVGAARWGGAVAAQRLTADGSDARTGIAWDGWSFAAELDGGRPVKLANATEGEKVRVGSAGLIEVEMVDSSAVVLTF